MVAFQKTEKVASAVQRASQAIETHLIRAKTASGFDSVSQVKKCCPYAVAGEQKARATYDNILRLSDDPDVNDAIRFLRAREIVHFQRFGDTNHDKLSGFYHRAGVGASCPDVFFVDYSR